MRMIIVVASVVFFLVLGCAPEAPVPVDNEPVVPMEIIGVVEVTNEPLAWVVERLASPLVEIRFRASEAPDPAYWSPTTDDVLAMQQADLIVLNGASYEPWIANVSLPASRLVDTTAELRERLIPVSEGVTHSHGLEGEHEHTGTAFTTWLDPTLLTEQARAVEAALTIRWPEHGDLFAERFTSLAADLEALDAELVAATAPFADQSVVFSHPVYQYFQRRYGLAGSSVHFEPDVLPGSEQWAALDHVLGHQQTRWMIWEAEPGVETVRALTEKGLGVIVFEPGARPSSVGEFIVVMKANAAALRDASASQDPAAD